MIDIIQQHALAPDCPLSCLEYRLPPRTYNALKRHLRWRYSGHPTIGHVADLHRQGRLIDIRGLGVGGIERIASLLEPTGLRTTPDPARETTQST